MFGCVLVVRIVLLKINDTWKSFITSLSLGDFKMYDVGICNWKKEI